jgi:hypothetical protein
MQEAYMQKWEYLIKGELSSAELNELGDQGWELVTVTFNDIGSPAIFYFKRRKSSISN